MYGVPSDVRHTMISFFLVLISLSWKAIHYSRALSVRVLTSENNSNELNNCFPLIVTKLNKSSVSITCNLRMYWVRIN